MSDDLDRRCDTPACGTTHAVSWSPVFNEFLCPQCRHWLTERELRPTPGLPPGFYHLDPNPAPI